MTDKAEGFTYSDIEVIIEMAKRRATHMHEMKAALLAGDDQAALRLARLVCGLTAERTISDDGTKRHIGIGESSE